MRTVLIAFIMSAGLIAQSSGTSTNTSKQAGETGERPKDGAKQWEYKTVHSDADLNKLVSQGWEFVTMSSDGLGQHYLLRRLKPVMPPQATQPMSDLLGHPVFNAGGDVLAPVVLYKVEPTYTSEAQAKRIEGGVALYLEVGPDGRTNNIRILRSLDPGLDQKAIEAVRQWRFRSGMKAGYPVTVIAEVEVSFRLRDH